MAGKSSRITALKVRHICCEAYKEKLQKKLLKHEGVCSVEMNPEKSLVLVRGKVDPNSLLHVVARTGKHAEIVCSNKKPSHKKCCSSSEKSYRHSCCQDHTKSHKIEREEQHKCEDYVPPFVDEGMSRDHFWRPMPMFHDTAAPFSGFLDHQYHGGAPFWHQPRLFPPPPPAGFRGRHWPGVYGYGY
ncbi:hypothetical protein C2S53_001463 [Perilla frutescens var. hirtella]|uniref:HMA domain-containing protein n=1 Tax=Perilla frutescens var. hirtella TaxID=608512 RepID=A0AAD4J379_PERFH|nr:hypothetical protein C2S53_001463 [Perilla frutescens var. hirtella]